MSDVRHPDEALERELIAYVLGELGATESEQLEQRLAAGDSDLRSRLAELSATTLALSRLPDEAWAPLEEPPPPPALDVGAPRSAAARRPHRETARRPLLLGGRLSIRPLAAAAAAAVLVATGVLVGALIKSSAASTAARIVASADLKPIDSVDPTARAVFRLASDRTARFEVSNLAPTDSHHVYELWLMDSTRDLVSIATFRVDAGGRAQLTLTLPVAPSHFRYLDVSLQPLDGTALHSNISVLRGAAPA